jgi:hypothetical protein
MQDVFQAGKDHLHQNLSADALQARFDSMQSPEDMRYWSHMHTEGKIWDCRKESISGVLIRACLHVPLKQHGYPLLTYSIILDTTIGAFLMGKPKKSQDRSLYVSPTEDTFAVFSALVSR